MENLIPEANRNAVPHSRGITRMQISHNFIKRPLFMLISFCSLQKWRNTPPKAATLFFARTDLLSGIHCASSSCPSERLTTSISGTKTQIRPSCLRQMIAVAVQTCRHWHLSEVSGDTWASFKIWLVCYYLANPGDTRGTVVVNDLKSEIE
jgi:hypothetical protein